MWIYKDKINRIIVILIFFKKIFILINLIYSFYFKFKLIYFILFIIKNYYDNILL